ncbi:CGNR zinc finger domain-containing protein [Amycolatopsis sp. NBC_01286]|nr:CGNR zinc finger domain-containing protein [Amycolatopsis sp. NBC_01286]
MLDARLRQPRKGARLAGPRGHRLKAERAANTTGGARRQHPKTGTSGRRRPQPAGPDQLPEPRNRSRTWCSMRVCGNREKARGPAGPRGHRLKAAAPRRTPPRTQVDDTGPRGHWLRLSSERSTPDQLWTTRHTSTTYPRPGRGCPHTLWTAVRPSP